MLTSTWIPLITVAVALIGGIFAALRFNRLDAKAVVETQSTVLMDMKGLNEELTVAMQRVRVERDELLDRIIQSSTLIKSLEQQVIDLHEDSRANSGLAKETIIGLERDIKRLTAQINELRGHR